MTDRDRSAPVPGSVGVGVVDGGHNDESQAEDIRKEVQDWLHRAGIKTSPVDVAGTGSPVGPLMESVVQNVDPTGPGSPPPRRPRRFAREASRSGEMPSR